MRFVTHGEAETERLARQIAPLLRRGTVLALIGEMGAGKTAFVRGLAAGLGCADAVSSPTFSLMNVYGGGRLPLFHFDLYRLKDVQAVEDIGFADVLDDGIAAVEWPQVALPLLGPYARIHFEQGDADEQRVIDVQSIEGVEAIDLSGC